MTATPQLIVETRGAVMVFLINRPEVKKALDRETSQLALKACKRVLLESGDWPRSELFTRQRDITEAVFRSEAAKEGAGAFSEKRAPVWKGR